MQVVFSSLQSARGASLVELVEQLDEELKSLARDLSSSLAEFGLKEENDKGKRKKKVGKRGEEEGGGGFLQHLITCCRSTSGGLSSPRATCSCCSSWWGRTVSSR